MAQAAGAPILVVDDEPSLREMLNIALKRSGFQVVTENGVRSALARIREASPAFPLVITDLVMPDGSGLEVLAGAKARSAATEVIVMTAHSTVEAAISAMRAGASDFIVKPFSPAHMIAQAEKAIERHALFSENQRLRAQLSRLDPQDIELGESPPMVAISELVSMNRRMLAR